MATIDICLSSEPGMLGAPALMRVASAGDAQAIADAINGSTIYQGEHLIAWTRETSVEEPAAPQQTGGDDRSTTSGAPVIDEGAES